MSDDQAAIRTIDDSTTSPEALKVCASAWALSPDVDKQQHALGTLQRADPEFARRITARMLPKREELEPDVIRRVLP